MSSQHDLNPVIDALGGRSAVAEYLGVTVGRVAHVIKDGELPSSWWPALRELATARGVDLPMALFKWREPSGAAATFDIATAAPEIKAAAKT